MHPFPDCKSDSNSLEWTVKRSRQSLDLNSTVAVASIVWFALWVVWSFNVTAADPLKANLEQDQNAIHILEQHCTHCHGVARQEAGLRLDNDSSFRLGGDSGPAFISGDSQKSSLIQYVRGEGDQVMPPEGPRLKANEIRILSEWIERGANWPVTSNDSTENSKGVLHWSLQPIVRPKPPMVHRTSWIRNEIDSFVLSKLEQEDVEPSVEADRRTLIRRLSLDLLGLPPTLKDIDGFVEDQSSDAYERMVDRFLASPAFGERWARHWLDQTQYAESSGCVIDLPRTYAWRWRDWVVSAINQDLPFDQFTVQQLAGDRDPIEPQQTRIATGFLRNALNNHEAGIDLEAEYAKTTVDRTSMVGAAWLGLTLGCAECHSHKYDPITQRDFYRMYAFFDGIQDQDIDAPSLVANDSYSELRFDFERDQLLYIGSTSYGQSTWESKILKLKQIWHTPTIVNGRALRSLSFAMVHPMADGSMTVDGRISSTDNHYFTFETSLSSINAIRVEMLADLDRFHQGPGRNKKGDCILSGVSISVSPKDKQNEIRTLPFRSVDVDYCQAGYHPFDATTETDEEKVKGWAVNQKGLSHAAVFVLDSPLECQNSNVTVRLHFLTGLGRTPSRFRLTVTDATGDELVDQTVPADISRLVAKQVCDRTPAERALIKRYYQSIHPHDSNGLMEWTQRLDCYASWTNPRGAECIQEGWKSKETYVHVRGDFRRRGNRVEPGIPAVFAINDPLDDKRPWTRRDLANWIVHPSNPLTARVAANSIWQALFGAGLVHTPGDFGRQGELPTHPELLDWLASEYMQVGWSRKELVRMIVSSATYRQTSTVSQTASHDLRLAHLRLELLRKRDPQNRWLARQNRFRLDAESVRDSLLHQSGQLDLQLGGPSYRANGPDDEPREGWEREVLSGSENGKFRRGLYVAIPRTLPDPMLTTFDATDGATACPLRQRTNTPLQAMTLLNDPLFVEAARSLAKHNTDLDYDSLDPRVRIQQMWIGCLGRQPKPQELQVLEDLYDRLVIANTTEVWFVIARSILNLDEMITRE
jgi:mono/diheme cytochrome c family protein